MRVAILGVSLCLGLSVAQATIIDINSGPGIGSNNISGENFAIAVDPSWQPNEGGVWVSFRDDTGGRNPGFVVPSVLSEINTANLVGQTPSAIFFQPFTLPGSVNVGSVSIWADDTARILVDGVERFSANGEQSIHCAGPNPIGCAPGGGQSISLSGLGAGSHTLAIEAYQRQGGPFGVLYQSSVDSTGPGGSSDSPGSGGSSTPEPGTYALLGSGLIALLGLARQRIRRA
jgi:hypothetical protein